MTGTIKTVNHDRGFGFILACGRSVEAASPAD